MVSVDPKKFMTLDQHGHSISHQSIEEFNKKFDSLLAKAKKLAYQSQEDISLEKALAHFINYEDLSPTDLALLHGLAIIAS